MGLNQSRQQSENYGTMSQQYDQETQQAWIEEQGRRRRGDPNREIVLNDEMVEVGTSMGLPQIAMIGAAFVGLYILTKK